MRRIFIVGVLAAILIADAAKASVAEAAPIPRTGKWDLSYSDNICDLAAAFGNGDDEIVAKISAYAPDMGFQIQLSGPALKTSQGAASALVDFGPNVRSQQSSILYGTIGNVPTLSLARIHPDGVILDRWDKASPKISPADFGDVNNLTVNWGKSISLTLGSMSGPLRSLNECADNLVKIWGFDPVQQKALRRPAIPRENPAAWILSADYTREIILQHYIGEATFRLDIEASGQVTDVMYCLRQVQENFPIQPVDYLKHVLAFPPHSIAKAGPLELIG